ncbi:glycosyltransferase family 39 protein [Ottowia sp.]|uniref:glycosyltransferase family 39 protein n=1 Tax=Ottowia sp. TaxID=1898956 RepID=UPI002B9F13AD|nr:glycosyltransferase family 39 protein [Ottowia sp.]HOB66946.1 glycosyltransferase family 39 protein [Ottowia sp.]HPZ55972.1 glycosyltransferase family 39 protein [Ottowia sp.]HQD47922.1 glycosyltransferase family 39 protein [Ottowia sp.]
MSTLTDPRSASDARVPRALLVAAALYAAAWSLVPPWVTAGFPLDVVESLTWGHEGEWGYYKHPPMAPWVLYVFYRVFGRAGPYLLSQVCIGFTLWLVWLTGRRLMTRERAWLGAALTMGTVFLTRPALEFNHNVAQLPLWAGIGWALLAALQDGRLRQWLLLGLLAGLCLLTKYSGALLLACLGVYVLATPQRRVLRTPGPWLAVLLAVAVLAPHLRWLWQHGGLPFAYVSSRAGADVGHPRADAWGFLGMQFINHVPLLLIVLWAVLPAWRQARRAKPVEAGVRAATRLHTDWPGYLLVLALAPGLLTALLGLAGIARVRDMWGVPMWTFSGLLAVACLPTAWLGVARPRLSRGLLVWLVLISVLSGAYLAFIAQWRQRPVRTDWPSAALAAHAQASWDGVSQCPLDVVAGEYHLAGTLAVALSPRQPSVLIHGDPRYSPWVTPARLQAGGALWIWTDDDASDVPPEPLNRVAAQADLRPHDGTWQVPWPREPAGRPFTVHWRAYVPAACARARGG